MVVLHTKISNNARSSRRLIYTFRLYTNYIIYTARTKDPAQHHQSGISIVRSSYILCRAHVEYTVALQYISVGFVAFPRASCSCDRSKDLSRAKYYILCGDTAHARTYCCSVILICAKCRGDMARPPKIYING